jgi:3'-phosphoadenosine 5'-phosphosulfate sulfotransferase (PAPS reductase)/FAD synthetase
MALLMWERGEDFEMVFSDTGAELPETYWLLPRLAERVGKKLNVVSNASFFQRLVHWGYFLPGPRTRWCTKELKQVPQDYYWEAHETDSVMVGIRL